MKLVIILLRFNKIVFVGRFEMLIKLVIFAKIPIIQVFIVRIYGYI